ncbi:hypothetical protein [Nocardioides psychrotolerans]|uniref:hypothetical protein n=1 Tax=Nocardioides psychrotolerans TaxID=1005945 RepID=UPI0011604642|nr:hypothetical protein [Nocardioides psychrotolerans]
MRFRRSLALVAVALVVWAVGPLALLLALGSLAVPRVRRWLRPTWRVVAGWTASVAVLVGVVVLLPDGFLPIPPGIGSLATPRYVGSPATPQPIDLRVPQHPRLAVNGTSAMHNDGWSTDAYAGPGPLGESPSVDTAWYGGQECATLAFDAQGRLIALCGNISGPVLHVLDPETMRAQDTLELPARRDNGNDKLPWENLCGGSYFFLDDQDRAVTATTERAIVAVTTADGRGEPDLTIQTSYDLSGDVPEDDCLIALMPDWDGRIWFGTEDGRVGFVDPGTGKVRLLELGEEIANSFSVGEDGGVYVVTVEALYKLGVDPAGRPTVRWRTIYDRGTEQKDGQLSRGSGTTPTILPSGLVAITDNADPKMNVQFYTVHGGDLVCQQTVFEDGESASDNSLVAVGPSGVVVENNYGYTGPLRTVLGRATPGGFARVDVVDGDCGVVWTNDQVAPTSVAKVSLANGLVYAYTKRRSLLGVNAWYFTAIDARTGRTAFSVRTGIGSMFNNHYSAVTLGPDGSAYVATLTGMVRIRDRERSS